MTADRSGYRSRIRLDRNTLIVARICARQVEGVRGLR